MVRTFFATAFAALIIATSGCQMAATPYDYTYPAYGGCCTQASCDARAGSYYGPSTQLVPVPEAAAAPVGAQAPGPIAE